MGTANVFGPKVAERVGPGNSEADWEYRDNPDGGMELWQGCFDPVPEARHPAGENPRILL